METCTYDSPASMQREVWRDGHLLAAYSYKLFFLTKWPVPARNFHMGANVGIWKEGQIIGSKDAMERSTGNG